ncbi:MAG: NAD(P)-dependent oxidoreductase [Pseudomonadota bacterium]
MKKPKSLVTGACGFIGSHVVEVLTEAGHDVIATDLESSYETRDDKRKVSADAVRNSGAVFIASDMTKISTLRKLPMDVDYIFHVASVFSYGVPWELLYNVNVKGTQNLIELVKENRKLRKFVLWGAGGVYGAPERQEIPFREDVTLPDPPNNYLRSKWMQEFYIMQCGQKIDLPWVSVRPTTVYGPRGYYGGGQMLMGLASAPVLMAPRNFTGRIPFIHVRDVARAALHLAVHNEAVKQVYNVNDDSLMTTIEFFKFMADLRGHKFFTLPAINHYYIRKLAKTIGAIEAFITADILGIGPFMETDGVDYLNGDFVYSNEKLKSTGFEFLYPDPRPGIEESIKWFLKNGWMKG